MALRSGGRLWLEHGYDQSDAVVALLLAQGYDDVQVVLDDSGVSRFVSAMWPGFSVS